MKTKHRLIGIVVLGALAVIIIPLFFARSAPGGAEKTLALSNHIPNPPGKPDIQQIAIPAQPSPAVKSASAAPSADLATQALQPVNQANNDDNNDAVGSNIQTAENAQPAASVSAQSTANGTTQQTAQAIDQAMKTTAVAANATPSTQKLAANSPDTSAQSPAMTTVDATSVSSNLPAASANNTIATDNATPAVVADKTINNAASAKDTEKTKNVPRNKAGVVKSKLAAHDSKKHAVGQETKIKQAELAQAWTVQLGTFSQKKNAEQLVKELRAKGFAAYVHVGESENGKVNRVFVGPEVKREKADAMVKKLAETLNLKGVVVKYEV